MIGQASEFPRPTPSFCSAIKVLVVDDEDGIRRMLGRVLGARGMHVTLAEGGNAALDILARESIDVVVLDVHMPESPGLEVLANIKARGFDAEVIMMTAFHDVGAAVKATKVGAFAFLEKPFVNEALVGEVLNAAQYQRRRKVSPRKRAESAPSEMIGESPGMKEIYRRIAGVAPSGSTVLVLGESGTGKELVARAIHRQSKRASKPFVAVNCAAIARELIESELFGHTRGAFTSALSARAGLFEAANGGTLLLDEIGELPPSSQVKLLRVLQSGEVKPVGSDVSKQVDVRVVAATNVDLRAAMEKGTFRQDLFYRLNVISIRLPPLRERGEDVLTLARHFIDKYAGLSGRKWVPHLDTDAARCLARYRWPGNVRELEHAIEHAVVLSEGETISRASLPTEVQRAVYAEANSQLPPPALDAPAVAFEVPAAPRSVNSMADVVASLDLTGVGYAEAKRRLLAAFNEAYVKALLDACSGNISEAARRSGLDRSNFRRLLRSLAESGIEVPHGDRDSGRDSH